MLLSIGMIVKNEEKHLRKCLEGIKPILEGISSELIIADTGSTDNTVAIAREFTNKVFKIKWNDDFAEARNATIDRAKGQWYMYIDADEFFDDVTDIIEFFNSGEYKNYRSARHPMKILLDDRGGHTMFHAARLHRKNSNTKFEGRIHEGITPELPQKLLCSRSVHVGNQFSGEDGEELRKRKLERNLPLLLRELEEKPSNLRIVMLITNEYGAHKVYDKWIEFTEIGLSDFEKPVDDISYHFFRLQRARYYGSLGRHEELAEDAQEYLDTVKGFRTRTVCVIDMLTMRMRALAALGREEEAIAAFIEYKAALSEYAEGKLNTDYLRISGISSLESEKKLAAKLAEYCLDRDNFGRIGEWIEDPEAFISAYLKNCFRAGRTDRAVAYYRYLTERWGIDSAEYLSGIEIIENSAREAGVKPTVAQAFTEVDDGSDYVRLQHLRRSHDETLLERFIGAGKGYGEIYSDVILIAYEHGVNFAPFIENLEAGAIPSYAVKLADENVDLTGETESLKAGYFFHLLTTQMFDIYRTERNLRLYVSAFYKYLRLIYNDGMFTPVNENMLPPDARFAIHATRAFACGEAGDVSGFIANIRNALKIDPGMKDIISGILRRLQQDILERG